ncbi:MAG: zinc ribbon domain-containing protein [Oscillospiraceae bacterium]|jgi:predicted amidophosphoribosyltransferase|nr:zinc ribbon domain-containing protein [Oscillospiraceae bacterium]
MFCPNCAKKNEKDAATCEQCGSAVKTLAPPVQRHHQKPKQAMMQLKRKQQYTLSITSSAKYAGSTEFDVIANDANQGKVKSGKTIVVYAEEPEIAIMIKAWGLNPLKATFTVKENAHVELGMWKKNITFYSVSGAEIEK